jgi:hypothetical protein
MFNAGAARMHVEFQDPVESVDALFAPVITWKPYARRHVQVENEQATVSDSFTTGPREESVKTMTLVVRHHPNFGYSTRQRVVNLHTGELFEVEAIRYNSTKSMCYVDVRGGQASG